MRNERKGVAVLLFGMPGAGKGTQGKALGALPGFLHVSSGEIFRNLNSLGRLGKEVLGYISDGQLVPDDLTVRIFLQHLRLLKKNGQYDEGSDLLILDGVPRTYGQAELLGQHLEVVLIFNLVIADDQEAIDRIRSRALTENRIDDSKVEIIRNRIATFRRETADTLRYYDGSSTVEIDASRRPIEVLSDLANRLCDLQVEKGRAPIGV